MSEERLELDFNSLISKVETKKITVKYAEGQYTFNYHDLKWKDRMSLASQCIDVQNGTFDAGRYYEESLLKMLDDDTFPGKSPTLLRSLSSDVLDQLVHIVPEPWGIIDEIKAVKK